MINTKTGGMKKVYRQSIEGIFSTVKKIEIGAPAVNKLPK